MCFRRGCSTESPFVGAVLQVFFAGKPRKMAIYTLKTSDPLSSNPLFTIARSDIE